MSQTFYRAKVLAHWQPHFNFALLSLSLYIFFVVHGRVKMVLQLKSNKEESICTLSIHIETRYSLRLNGKIDLILFDDLSRIFIFIFFLYAVVDEPPRLTRFGSTTTADVIWTENRNWFFFSLVYICMQMCESIFLRSFVAHSHSSSSFAWCINRLLLQTVSSPCPSTFHSNYSALWVCDTQNNVFIKWIATPNYIAVATMTMMVDRRSRKIGKKR